MKKIALAFTILLFGLPLSARADTLFVEPGGIGTACTAQAPCGSIQQATPAQTSHAGV